MHPGTQQDQRLAAALHPGYILPEEFTLAERIRLTLAYASKLRFATNDGSDAGCWDEALICDEAVLLADIASYPLGAEQQRFAKAWPWAGEKHLWWRVRQLLTHFDRWCQWLARHDTPMAAQVQQATMQPMATGMRDMLHEAIRCFGIDPVEAAKLHPAWRIGDASQGAPLRTETPGQRLQLLRRLWGALCMAIARLRPLAEVQLSNSLSSGRHEPAMGLMLAALRLYQDTRVPMNRFPERLTDFYYHDVLRMRPRAPAVEQVHLRFERDPRYRDPVLIPRGTYFMGGKDGQGHAIEFAADQPLEVTDSQVAAVYNLRLARDPLISPEKELGYATRLLTQSIPLQAPEAAYAETPAWWPLFGGKIKGEVGQARDATLGFALASPMLAMKEGERRIGLALRLSHPANDDEGLLALLRCAASQRDAGWLGKVFACFGRYEQKHHPSRLAGKAAVDDAQALANDAWARAPRPEGDVQLCYLLARCLAAATLEPFRERLGRLFAAWLTAASEDLHPADIEALRKRAAELETGASPESEPKSVEIDDPLILIYPHEHADGNAAHDRPQRDLIFARVFRGIWQAGLSVADGWMTRNDVLVRRQEGDAGPGWGGCIEISLRLGAECPAIVPCKAAVHGADWPSQPALRLVLQTRTQLFAYSLLQQLVLHDIVISADVRGVRDVTLYNQLGRLDAGKPFLPFGPAPALGAYFMLGNDELAAKPIRSLRLDIRWGQLPTGEGGFGERYRGYPGEWDVATFRVSPEVLRDGHWRGGSGGSLSLFHGEFRLDATSRLDMPEPDLALYHRPQPDVPTPLLYGANTRNGFFRLVLCSPGSAFGHALYPRLLSEALTRNARLKRTKLSLPLPQEPYTPTIDQISLDYTASQLVPLRTPAPAAGQLFHLYPFGHDCPRAHAGTDGVPLLPRYMQDGNLYIGLSGADPQGALSLYFQLRQESATECRQADRPPVTWSVWCEDGWQVLAPGCVLSDGTLGFLTSGVVVLNLPSGMSVRCPRLPGDLYWLRLSANGNLGGFAGLYAIFAQAVSASRVRPRAASEPLIPLLPGTIKAPLHPIGGLRTVQQIGPSFGLRAPDVADALRVRSAERLHHKNRASAPWDYERLLLDAFPQIFKVKCFFNGEAPGAGDAAQPGGVLAVVVPAPRQGALFHSTEAPRFDAAVLEQMAGYLRERSSPSVGLVVRNAAYERIQVRCELRLVQGCHPGAALVRINRAIVEFLSPWHTEGNRACFDWEVRAGAIEARLRELEDVDVVGPISLLHIVRTDDNVYRLRDTARAGQPSPTRQVRPVQPWSLALPTPHHLIELAGAQRDWKAKQTGFGKLEVGSTFIVGAGTAGPGKEAS